MSIRSKLAWTFILLLIFGITAISSYSILFIRNYLLEEGEQQIESDARWLAITVQNLPADDRFSTQLNEAGVITGYRISVFDEEGRLYASVPFDVETEAVRQLDSELIERLGPGRSRIFDDRPDPDWLTALVPVPRGDNPVRYLQISMLKDDIYAPIKTIRWIIYTGMFISIGLVILVSVWFSRYMSRPIVQLEQTARSIAEGNVDASLHLNRSDEFGTLADSLNRMASRLQEDNRRLQEIYERQSQFFADITHELRNPLHTISGALEMLQMDDLPDEQKKNYLMTASRQTDRIHRLFLDLKTLQRYDSDEHFIEKKEFNIASVLMELFEVYYPSARAKGVDMEMDVDSWTVLGDPDKIEQVMDNLISNAVKYTNEGEITIRCRPENGSIRVEVEDTGIGISENHLARLFDRFYRTDKARSRDKGGTGLGLAVVKSILDAHGTTIEVKSRPGEGSRFAFTLPRAEAPPSGKES